MSFASAFESLDFVATFLRQNGKNERRPNGLLSAIPLTIPGRMTRFKKWRLPGWSWGNAPAHPGEKIMEQITGTAYIDSAAITETQRNDLNNGMKATKAFWRSAQQDRTYRQTDLRPHGRCIYAALAVRDILHGAGQRDATVLKTGLDLRMLTKHSCLPMHVLTIGDPDTPYVRSLWNAHLVVRLGDILIDPSFAQTRRGWNNSPHYAGFIAGAPEGHTVSCSRSEEAQSTTACWWDEGERSFQISYFQLPRDLEIRTRGWRNAPDARPAIRARIVARAVAMLDTQNSHDTEKVAA